MPTVKIDIDGVLVTEKPTFERSLAQPIDGAKKTLKELKALGYTIILETARGWAEYAMTVDQLMRYNFEYDLLLMGKPIADVTIDDRAIKFENWDQVRLDLLGKDDAYSLYNVRQATRSFLLTRRRSLVAVEIAPMKQDEMPFPECYVEPARYCEYHIAVGPGEGVKDFFDVWSYDPQPDTIIAVNVLEHMERVWEFPEHCKRVLKGHGIVQVLVPYNLRFHGPAPDLWRFTDTGLKHLMKGFECRDLRTYGPANKPYAIGAEFIIGKGQ